MQETANLSGLTESEAKHRLGKFGFNELEERRFASLFENFLKILTDPMGLMLLILSGVYWGLGKNSDAMILLAAYIPIVGVDVLLEIRSQKALRALKKSVKSSCHVVREGKMKSIPVRELVPGDLLVLEEGQTLPADGVIRQLSNLTIDESSLTGESVPIEKAPGDEALSGTSVLTGNGLVEIQKTGLSSQLGSIAKVLREFEAVPSPLLRTIKKAVRIVFFIALALAAVVFAVSLSKNMGIGESIVTALTLAMAAIPEEFPLVFTLYLSLAAYRLSKHGILVKSLPAVEGLGRVDVICTDKTGTLTEGRFLLEEISGAGKSIPEKILARALVLSCEPKAVDAMESSIFEFVGKRWGADTAKNTHENWELQFDYPFDLKEKYMCHVWREKSTGRQFLAMKGALEGVLAHCDPATEKTTILKAAKELAEKGKRLLGLAFAEGTFSGDRASDEKNLSFLGILGFADPIRPSVPHAIEECKSRGVRLKMLTGDHLLTAHAIADAIKLPHSHDELFSGPELEKLGMEARTTAYKRGAIFARLKPEQKLELVRALKAEGDIVAMTGDGINDAPALKLADIGISMGERATDVARSSAQMVLLKNDFGGIVSAIVEGQNVLRSLSESFGYLIAFHIPIILVALIQAFFLEAPILRPIHIVLLELIVHPISAFVFSEAPRAGRESRGVFLTPAKIIWSSGRGLALTLCSVFLFFFFPGDYASRSSAAVLALVAGNIGLLVAEAGGFLVVAGNRSMRVFVASLLLLLVVLVLSYAEPVARVFLIESPSLKELGMIVGMGVGIALLAPISVPVVGTEIGNK